MQATRTSQLFSRLQNRLVGAFDAAPWLRGIALGRKKLAVRLLRYKGASCGALLAHRNLTTEWCGVGDVVTLSPGGYPGMAGKLVAQFANLKSRSHIDLSVNTGWM